MNPHFNQQQLILLFGGAVAAISILLLGVYLFQKMILKPEEPKPTRVRVEDEAAFTLATVKSVITQLKTDQKTMQGKLLVVERRAEENAHMFELLAREFDHGLMIFDAQGYITFSNPQVRRILAVDTWSRRRYGEIFHDLPAVANLIGECVETGMDIQKRTVGFQDSDGSNCQIEVSVLLTRDRCGVMEAVVCVFREAGAPGARTSIASAN